MKPKTLWETQGKAVYNSQATALHSYTLHLRLPGHVPDGRPVLFWVFGAGGRSVIDAKLVYASLWPFLEFKNDFQEKRKS